MCSSWLSTTTVSRKFVPEKQPQKTVFLNVTLQIYQFSVIFNWNTVALFCSSVTGDSYYYPSPPLSSPLLFSPPPHFIWLLCPSRWVWLYCYWAGVCWLAAVLLIPLSSCAMWLCLCLCVFVDRWQCTVGGNASNSAEYIFMSVTSHFI